MSAARGAAGAVGNAAAAVSRLAATAWSGRSSKGVLTMAEIARLKSSLRLTADQEPHWRPVEAQLRRISRLQMAQVESGRKPEVPQSSFQQLYYAARPLLDVMRPDQKERVRGLARSMGYGSVASMI